MKKVIFARFLLGLILFALLFLCFGCGSVKRISKTSETVKNTETVKTSTKDSLFKTEITLPSEMQMEFNLMDLINSSDFKSENKSGPGASASIEKKGGKIILKTKDPGKSETDTVVNTSDKETVYTYEYVYKEFNKLVKRLGFKHWLIIVLILVIVFRKLIAQILVLFFPLLRYKKVFSIVLGEK